MLNQKVADLLNQQINKEFYSAYLYLDSRITTKPRDCGFANGISAGTGGERPCHAVLPIFTE